MAILTNLDGTIDESHTATSIVTASLSVGAGEVGMCCVVGFDADFSSPQTPTITSWTQHATNTVVVTAFGFSERFTIFRRAGSFSATQTIDFAGVAQYVIAYIADKAADVDAGGTNGANAIVQAPFDTATTTTPTIDTLAALANANHTVHAYFAFMSLASNASNDGADGWTELDLISSGAPQDIFLSTYKVGDNTPTCGASASVQWSGYGIEWKSGTHRYLPSLGVG